MDADSSYGGSDTTQDSHLGLNEHHSLHSGEKSPPHHDEVTTAVHVISVPNPSVPNEEEPIHHYYHKNEITLPVNADEDTTDFQKNSDTNKLPHYLATANLNINESLEHHNNLEEMSRNYKSSHKLSESPSPPTRSPTLSGIDNPAYVDDGRSTFNCDMPYKDGLDVSSLHTSEEPLTEAVNLELVNMKPTGNLHNGIKEPTEIHNGNGLTTIPLKKEEEEVRSPYDEYFVPVNEHRKYIRGEKLYVTKDNRVEKSKSKCICWTICLCIIAAAVIIGILVAVGVIGGHSQIPQPVEVEGRNLKNETPLVKGALSIPLANTYPSTTQPPSKPQTPLTSQPPLPPLTPQPPLTPEPPLTTEAAVPPSTELSMIQVIETVVNHILDSSDTNNFMFNKDYHWTKTSKFNETLLVAQNYSVASNTNETTNSASNTRKGTNNLPPTNTSTQQTNIFNINKAPSTTTENTTTDILIKMLNAARNSSAEDNPLYICCIPNEETSQNCFMVNISNPDQATTKECNLIEVPNVIEYEFDIDNMQFIEDFANKNSPSYMALSNSLEELLKDYVMDQRMITKEPIDLIVKTMEFTPGSVKATVRIGWKYKNDLHMPVNETKLLNMLTDYLKESNYLLGDYHIYHGSTVSRKVIDQCLIENNGCEHLCIFDYNILDFLCLCPEGKVLADNQKNCIPKTRTVIPSDTNYGVEPEFRMEGDDYENGSKDDESNIFRGSFTRGSTDSYLDAEPTITQSLPAPTPEPTPEPEPQPTSKPEPLPEIKTLPSPKQEPSPEPSPEPSAEPTPEPTPEPIPEQEYVNEEDSVHKLEFVSKVQPQEQTPSPVVTNTTREAEIEKITTTISSVHNTGDDDREVYVSYENTLKSVPVETSSRSFMNNPTDPTEIPPEKSVIINKNDYYYDSSVVAQKMNKDENLKEDNMNTEYDDKDNKESDPYEYGLGKIFTPVAEVITEHAIPNLSPTTTEAPDSEKSSYTILMQKNHQASHNVFREPKIQELHYHEPHNSESTESTELLHDEYMSPFLPELENDTFVSSLHSEEHLVDHSFDMHENTSVTKPPSLEFDQINRTNPFDNNTSDAALKMAEAHAREMSKESDIKPEITIIISDKDQTTTEAFSTTELDDITTEVFPRKYLSMNDEENALLRNNDSTVYIVNTDSNLTEATMTSETDNITTESNIETTSIKESVTLIPNEQTTIENATQTTTDNIIETTSKTMDVLNETTSKTMDVLTENTSKTMDVLNETTNKPMYILNETMDVLNETTSKTMDVLNETTSKPMDVLNETTSKTMDVLTENTSKTMDVLNETTNKPIDILNETMDVLNETTSKTMDVLNETTSKPMDVLNETTSKTMDVLTENTSKTMDVLNETTNKPIDILNETMDVLNETTSKTMDVLNETTSKPMDVLNETTIKTMDGLNETTSKTMDVLTENDQIRSNSLDEDNDTLKIEGLETTSITPTEILTTTMQETSTISFKETTLPADIINTLNSNNQFEDTTKVEESTKTEETSTVDVNITNLTNFKEIVTSAEDLIALETTTNIDSTTVADSAITNLNTTNSTNIQAKVVNVTSNDITTKQYEVTEADTDTTTTEKLYITTTKKIDTEKIDSNEDLEEDLSITPLETETPVNSETKDSSFEINEISDEKFGNEIFSLKNNTDLNQPKPVTEDFILPKANRCISGQFQCLNGTSVKDGLYCVSITDRCDSVFDCTDNSDEINCVEEGCPNNFQCASKQCLKRHLVCDGILNCNDGSDEIECDKWTCDSNEFSCGPSNRCIPMSWKCDGRTQCPNGSDEIGCTESNPCPPHYFRCSDNQKCVPQSFKCDGHRDCSNGGDEDESVCTCNKEEQFKCEIGGGCISKTNVCDGIAQCADKSDEWNCLKLDHMVQATTEDSEKKILQIQAHNNTWYPICMDWTLWNTTYADKACQNLGYSASSALESVPKPKNMSAKTSYVLKFLPNKEQYLHFEQNQISNCDQFVSISCQEYVCGSPSFEIPSARIVGGDKASPTQWPSLALLYNKKNNLYCTSTLLTPLWAVTSYSCIASHTQSLDEDDWFLYAGGTNKGDNSTSQVRKLEEIVIHPQTKFSNLGFINDAVLLRLRKPLHVNVNVSAVCLPNDQIEPRQLCIVAGWGINKPGELSIQQYLHYLPVPLIDTAECNSTKHYNGQIGSDKICAGYTDLDKTPCFNDEGAPLMCFSDKAATWELHGLLSHHGNCGMNKHPAIYTVIDSKLRNWITNTIGKQALVH